jgi:hypothetical protein
MSAAEVSDFQYQKLTNYERPTKAVNVLAAEMGVVPARSEKRSAHATFKKINNATRMSQSDRPGELCTDRNFLARWGTLYAGISFTPGMSEIYPTKRLTSHKCGAILSCGPGLELALL